MSLVFWVIEEYECGSLRLSLSRENADSLEVCELRRQSERDPTEVGIFFFFSEDK